MKEFEKLLPEAVNIIMNSKYPIALTGAGISVESGIPDFRSGGGLWDKYDPMIYAHIDSFRSDPEKVWGMLLDMTSILINARPNDAHKGLTSLQEMGKMNEVITQNIDGLHQAAGTGNVIEYHGNGTTLSCISCGNNYKVDTFNINNNEKPYCSSCQKLLKPDIVFFGEAIPSQAVEKSANAVSKADTVLVVGTSATVYPAAAIPLAVSKKGGQIIEINPDVTDLTKTETTVHLRGYAGEVMNAIVEEMTKRLQ